MQVLLVKHSNKNVGVSDFACDKICAGLNIIYVVLFWAFLTIKTLNQLAESTLRLCQNTNVLFKIKDSGLGLLWDSMQEHNAGTQEVWVNITGWSIFSTLPKAT